VIDSDAWAQALLYVRGVLTEGMHTGDFIINGHSFAQGDIGKPCVDAFAYELPKKKTEKQKQMIPISAISAPRVVGRRTRTRGSPSSSR